MNFFSPMRQSYGCRNNLKVIFFLRRENLYAMIEKNLHEDKNLKLYRYRTIKSALLELENGSFYFAEPNELNDPIEGYLKIFWQGDKPAWEGLTTNIAA